MMHKSHPTHAWSHPAHRPTHADRKLRLSEAVLRHPVCPAVGRLGVAQSERAAIDLVDEHPGVDEGEAVLGPAKSLLLEPGV